MELCYLFDKPSANQQKVFESVFPIVERYFEKATAFVATRREEVVFNCGPDETKLNQVCAYLNDLSDCQNSRISFEIWCEDIGGAVPMGIVACW